LWHRLLDNCYLNSSIPLPSIAEIPDTLLVDSLTIVARPYLGRDFMPYSSPDGKSLLAVIQLSEIDSTALPPDTELLYLWVLYDNDFWSSQLDDEGQPHLPFQAIGVGRCGPKWGPYVEVDVIVRFRLGGAIRQIRSTGVMIDKSI
jgi:hypothetical protein